MYRMSEINILILILIKYLQTVYRQTCIKTPSIHQITLTFSVSQGVHSIIISPSPIQYPALLRDPPFSTPLY